MVVYHFISLQQYELKSMEEKRAKSGAVKSIGLNHQDCAYSVRCLNTKPTEFEFFWPWILDRLRSQNPCPRRRRRRFELWLQRHFESYDPCPTGTYTNCGRGV